MVSDQELFFAALSVPSHGAVLETNESVADRVVGRLVDGADNAAAIAPPHAEEPGAVADGLADPDRRKRERPYGPWLLEGRPVPQGFGGSLEVGYPVADHLAVTVDEPGALGLDAAEQPTSYEQSTKRARSTISPSAWLLGRRSVIIGWARHPPGLALR